MELKLFYKGMTMNEVLFPTTLVAVSFLVYILTSLFENSRFKWWVRFSCCIAVMIASCFLMFMKYYTLSIVYLSGLCFFIILQWGLVWITPKYNKYRIQNNPWKEFLNKIGKTETEINPKGKVRIQDTVIPARSEGLYIAKNISVKVIRLGESFVVVEKVNNA